MIVTAFHCSKAARGNRPAREKFSWIALTGGWKNAPVRVRLAEGCYLAVSGTGETLLYGQSLRYGLTLEHALTQGLAFRVTEEAAV